MVAAIDKVVEAKQWKREHVFAWVDYLSIPQASRGQQKLAISSLVGYASVAHAFVIVAPPLTHADFFTPCNVATYNSRFWCRAENLAHSLRNGTDEMWVATGPSPELIVKQADDLDFLVSNLHVFQGTATVEADKLSLVPSVLGLYAELYAIALHVYENGDGKVPRGDPSVAKLLGDRVPVLPEIDDGVQSGSIVSVVSGWHRSFFPWSRRTSQRQKTTSRHRRPSFGLPSPLGQGTRKGIGSGPSFAKIVRMVRETEMSSQLRVLTLIHEAGDDEIFPPAIMIKASPFQSETSQRKAATRHDAAPKEMMLFGPLVQMMRDRLLDDKKTREQLVNDVLQRRVAASDRQIQAVARISGVWREKQKARSSRQSQQTRDSGASEEPPTVEQRAATSPEALAVADSAASEEPPTVEHRAATSPDHLAVATASSNGQDDSSELDLVI